MRTLLLLLLMTMSLCLLGAAETEPAPVSTTQPAADRTEWQQLLQQYGKTFSLRFTIEEDAFDYGPGNVKMPPMLTHYILPPKDIKTSDDFLAALRKWIPEADVTVDDADHTIVHIKERSLNDRGKLFLDEKVTMKFDGTVEQLWQQLSKVAGDRLEQDGPNTLSEMAYDDQVHTSFDVKDLTYRSLFTKVIPPNNSRILWIATLVKNEGHPLTVLLLSGPIYDPPSTRNSPTTAQKQK